MSLIFFSVKYNNGQLSRFYIILQCQSFSCWWLPQVTEPREWAMAPARQQRQLWSRQSPEPSEPERRTLSWSPSTPLHSPSVWPTEDLNRHQKPSKSAFCNTCWTFVTVFTALLLFFASLRCVQVQQWQWGDKGEVIGDCVKLRHRLCPPCASLPRYPHTLHPQCVGK